MGALGPGPAGPLAKTALPVSEFFCRFCVIFYSRFVHYSWHVAYVYNSYPILPKYDQYSVVTEAVHSQTELESLQCL